MNNFFKNRIIVTVLGIVVGLGILVGGYFLVASLSASNTDEEEFGQEAIVEKISPEEIDLTMEASTSNKAVKFIIGKADGIQSIEYQITYEADSTEQEQSEGGEPRVQRGITGEAAIKGGASFESEWLDLGSCSKNVCRYDTGVESVILTLKVVKDNGKIYEVEQSLEL